jgi:hypothetical protein
MPQLDTEEAEPLADGPHRDAVERDVDIGSHLEAGAESTPILYEESPRGLFVGVAIGPPSSASRRLPRTSARRRTRATIEASARHHGRSARPLPAAGPNTVAASGAARSSSCWVCTTAGEGSGSRGRGRPGPTPGRVWCEVGPRSHSPSETRSVPRSRPCPRRRPSCAAGSSRACRCSPRKANVE